MIHDDKDIKPQTSYALCRVVDAGVSGGGIALPGKSGEKFIMVESSGSWVTTLGARIDVDYRPGDEITLRPPRKIGESSVGKPIIDGPMTWGNPGWPKDIRLVALADIVCVTRPVPTGDAAMYSEPVRVT